MIATLVIACITFLCLLLAILFLPSFKIGNIKIGTYWIVALFGALALLICMLIPIDEVWFELTSDNSINPLKILVLFFSMTFLSIFLDEVGLFRFLAKKAVKIAKTNQFSLFLILYLLTSVLTVFTSNDIVILTLTPFICFFCKNTKINPIPYLVAEFAAANTWSMMFIIGNPTNIYLATSAGINFLDYFLVMAIPTIVAGMVELLILFLLFFKQLKQSMEVEEDEFVIESKVDLFVGIGHLAICLIFLIISTYIGVEMWLVSAICAGSLLLFILVMRIITGKNWSYLGKSLYRLPWQLIPFILSMFIIVIALNYQGISNEIANFLGDKGVIWTYGYSSFGVANLINNIPMSILYSSITSSLSGSAYYDAVYATIIGSNIGAFLTPVGALAGIMFTGLVEQNGVTYGYKKFILYGVIIAIPTISAALAMLFIM